MTHKLIKTENYLLIVDDSEIKVGDWIRWNNKITKAIDTTYTPSTKKIIAHLPLNHLPVLKGVPLLPPYFLHQEDDINELAEISSELQEGTYTTQHKVTYKHGFVDGYNKAKEKFRYTEEDVIKVIDIMCENYTKPISQRTGQTEIIQSLHKFPTEFECEVHNTEELESAEIDWMIIGRPKRITTAQGVQWVGKYK